MLDSEQGGYMAGFKILKKFDDYMICSERVYISDYFDYSSGKTQQYKETIRVQAKNQREAKKLIEKERQRLISEFKATGGFITLDRLFQIFLNDKKSRKNSTIADDLYNYEKIKKHFGKTLINKLTSDEIKKCLQSALVYKSESYVHGMYKMLNKLLNHAVKQEYLTRNPLIKISGEDFAKEPKKQENSEELLKRVKSFFEKEFSIDDEDFFAIRFKLMLLLTADGCLRKGELIALRWNNINIEERWINISERVYEISKKYADEIGADIHDIDSPKTIGSTRKLPISKITADYFIKYKEASDIFLAEKHLTNNNNYVFYKTKVPKLTKKQKLIEMKRETKIASYSAFSRKLVEKANDFGIKPFYPHAIRKAFNTIRNDADLGKDYWQYVLGHGHNASDAAYILTGYGLAIKKHSEFEKELHNVIGKQN